VPTPVTASPADFSPAAAAAVRFVLVEPSHAGNIGAAARALATMGFERLLVVAPRDPMFKAAPEARALAVGAVAILDAALCTGTLAEALDGVTLAFAMTGYDREFGPPFCELRDAARLAGDHLEAGAGEVAFVFGTERTGLSNHDVELCHRCCAIPAAALHSSLNLAQAVQVTAYECSMARRIGSGNGDAAAVASRFEPEQPAAVAELDAMYRHLEEGLIALGVLDPTQPRRTMPRLRRLLARAFPSAADVALLRGIFTAMIETKADRALRGGRGLPRRSD
jgi:tRNA/rRNA methyltransferase